MTVRALVTAEMPADAVAGLERLGLEVRVAGWGSTRRALGTEELVTALQDVRVLVCEVEQVDGAVLARVPDLRLVVTCRATPSNVDLAAAAAHGVQVTTTPGRNADSVADFTVALLLDVLRDVGRSERHLRGSGWHVGGDIPYFHFRGPELSRCTVGLLGLGAVGRGVAARLAGGFGTRVLVHDPYVDASPYEQVGLDELFSASDAVSLHVPVTTGPGGTAGLVGARLLRLLGPDGVLVNTARAGVVDDAALIAALRERALRAAALDVFAVEPLPRDSPYLGLDNVRLTPHVAGAGSNVPEHHAAMVLADVADHLSGRPPARLVRPATAPGGTP